MKEFPIPAAGESRLRLLLFFRWLRHLVLAGCLGLCFWQCSPQVQQAGVAPGKGDAAEPQIRVCIAENPRGQFLSFSGKYQLDLEEARYFFDDGVGKLSVSYRDGALFLSNSQRYFELDPPQTLIFKPELPRDHFIWNDVPYYGELLIHFREDRVMIVNELPVETYLNGVLPFEIPTNQSEYQEAVLAQAIAARSYALYRLENPVNELYDAWADERDQIYKGDLQKTPLAERAISNTRGIVLVNQGSPAIAQYHSTCGGVLEAYIGSDPGGIAYDMTDNEYNCKVSPYYRWVEFRKVETVLWNLSREFEIDSTQVNSWIESGFELDLNISQRKASGRVAEMVVGVQGAEYRVDGLRIRQILADESGKPLPSNFFFLNKSPANPEKFYIFGAGAGHGSGMCQWGAIGMSMKGYKYNNILGLYYPQLATQKMY